MVSMNQNSKNKRKIVKDLNELLKRADSVVICNNEGLSAEQDYNLRKEAYSKDVVVKVFVNNLMKLSLENTSHECLRDLMTGTNMGVFSFSRVNDGAQLVLDFIKDNNFSVKGISCGGNLLSASDLRKVANMPSKEQALSMLAGTLVSPVTNVMFLMQECIKTLIRGISALADVKSK